jgi:hydroxypyruvate isomerase
MNLDQTNQSGCTRRGLLKGATLAAAGMVGGSLVGAAPVTEEKIVKRGRIKQSVCAWCFSKWMNLDQLAARAAAMGLKSVELLEPEQFPIIKKYGLVCAITSSHGFHRGFAHKEKHAECIEILKQRIDACAAAGFPTVITFSGYREGMPDDVGLKNAVEGLKKVVGYAEKNKVNLCLEVLNSRVNVEMKGHPDYMCDNVEWAAEVCRQISSPRMTFLFDIYHVQIMEGDIIARIKKYHQYVGHYHTAGVPGRNEIDGPQEVNYPAVMRAIAETGYQGYVGQEFIPLRDPLQSLRAAVRLCDV